MTQFLVFGYIASIFITIGIIFSLGLLLGVSLWTISSLFDKKQLRL